MRLNSLYAALDLFRFERRLCEMRAAMAAGALLWTDRYFKLAGGEREACRLADSFLSRYPATLEPIIMKCNSMYCSFQALEVRSQHSQTTFHLKSSISLLSLCNSCNNV